MISPAGTREEAQRPGRAARAVQLRPADRLLPRRQLPDGRPGRRRSRRLRGDDRGVPGVQRLGRQRPLDAASGVGLPGLHARRPLVPLRRAAGRRRSTPGSRRRSCSRRRTRSRSSSRRSTTSELTPPSTESGRLRLGRRTRPQAGRRPAADEGEEEGAISPSRSRRRATDPRRAPVALPRPACASSARARGSSASTAPRGRTRRPRPGRTRRRRRGPRRRTSPRPCRAPPAPAQSCIVSRSAVRWRSTSSKTPKWVSASRRGRGARSRRACAPTLEVDLGGGVGAKTKRPGATRTPAASPA